MMEKRGVVDPGWTKPANEPPPQKTAAEQTREEQIRQLDNDPSKRVSDAAADKLENGK